MNFSTYMHIHTYMPTHTFTKYTYKHTQTHTCAHTGTSSVFSSLSSQVIFCTWDGCLFGSKQCTVCVCLCVFTVLFPPLPSLTLSLVFLHPDATGCYSEALAPSPSIYCGLSIQPYQASPLHRLWKLIYGLVFQLLFSLGLLRIVEVGHFCYLSYYYHSFFFHRSGEFRGMFKDKKSGLNLNTFWEAGKDFGMRRRCCGLCRGGGGKTRT